ncbi:hypothetical protein A6A08_13675 [Nocardiopsis sp. TSRI0078]|nr:hypothetical protein A6A08_13675 [Nocardiopsis sp. TSRI0078]
MTHPPNDGSFPGPPGGQPFPGHPGRPQPGRPLRPHGGPEPRPGQPHGGRPEWPRVPPAQPGHGAPGGTPPQQPPASGGPGRPGPPGRRRTGLVVGGVAAALLLMTSFGVVAWNLVDGRPYAGLPTCRELLPSDVLDGIPDADRPRAEGEYVSADEFGYGAGEGQEGFLGNLSCEVADGEERPVYVNASLFEYEDGGEAAADRRQSMEDDLRDREEGRHWEEEDGVAAVLDWSPVSAGEAGYAVVYEYDGYTDEEAVGTVFFVTVNVEVVVSYSIPAADFDEAEVLGFLDDFARQVERRLSREGERA